MTSCGSHGRHWFTQYGSVSFRLPYCVRCGEKNPNWWRRDRPKMIEQVGEEMVVTLEEEAP